MLRLSMINFEDMYRKLSLVFVYECFRFQPHWSYDLGGYAVLGQVKSTFALSDSHDHVGFMLIS